jgi:hypothetical protein
LTRDQATALVALLDAPQPLPSPGASKVTSCPEDDGGSALVTFRYATGPDFPVVVGLSGCEVSSSSRGWTMFRSDVIAAVRAARP